MQAIGRYVIQGELGRGGMGVVYRGFDPTLRRPVAIKTILGAVDPSRLARFHREASAAARLRHPAIVSVLEVGQQPVAPGQPPSPFIVMDLVEGEALDANLARGGSPPRRVVELLHEIALALAHAHEHGIVHRDVKPGNILIDGDGRPHLTDFGLARDRLDDTALTRTGDVVGTPAYMAPEQADGGRSAHDPLVDVYAVGAVLYEAIAGRRPFVADSHVALLKKVLVDDAVPPSRFRPDVHPDLETIALRCLEKEPARRYASAEALAAELGRFLAGERITARPLGRRERASRWIRRNRLLTAALVLAVAGVIGGAVAAIGATASARARLVGEARSVAHEARTHFEMARARPLDPDESAARRRERFDELLGLGLAALEASGRLVSIDGSTEALAQAEDAARGLGEVAIEAEQWGVARAALERAHDLAAGTERETRAAAALAEVEVARSRRLEQQAAVVRRWLDAARAGELSDRGGAYEDALFDLVGLRETASIELIVGALDALSATLAAVAREAYVGVLHPSPDEAAAGGRVLEGLAEAADRRLAGLPAEDGDDALLEAAHDRIEERASGPKSFEIAASADIMIAELQNARLGEEGRVLTRLLCEALARLGHARLAVPALHRYLAAEHDGHRAGPAGIALCILGGEDAEMTLRRALLRLGKRGLHDQVQPFLSRTGIGTEALANAGADELAEKAQLLFARGDLDAALAAFVRATELAPDHALGWDGVGVIRLVGGSPDSAIEAFDRALAGDPDYGPALRHRARARQSTGDPRGALADVERAVAVDGRNHQSWLERALVRDALGDRAGAVADSARAVELAPDEPDVLRQHATRLLMAGDRSGAQPFVEHALQIDPRHVRTLRLRARIRSTSGDIEGAIADLDRAIDVAPDDFDARFRRGLWRMELGDLDGADEDLRKAIALDPSIANAHVRLGQLLVQRGDLAEALTELELAVEIRSDWAVAWVALGNVRRQVGDLEGALAACERGVELDPGLALGWVRRGLALGSLGRTEAALADIEKALRIDPNEGTALVNRAVFLSELGRNEDALADLDRAVELAPDDAHTRSNRAELRRRLGDLRGAIADATRLVELRPRDPEAWKARVAYLLAADEVDAALRDADRAVALAPRDAQAWAYRANAHIGKVQLENARRDVRRALELDPRQRDALLVRDRLEELRGAPGGDGD